MMRGNLRKTKGKRCDVKRCPVCGEPILHATISAEGGDFCRKCGHFFGLKDNKNKVKGPGFENLE